MTREKCMRNSSTRVLRLGFGVALAILLCVASGWAQYYAKTEFKPTPIRLKYHGPRQGMAKVTTENESALSSKGYVKIGTVKAWVEAIPDPNPKFNYFSPDTTKLLKNAALIKAFGEGGDVVRFEKEGVVIPGTPASHSGKCTQHERSGHQGYNVQTGKFEPTTGLMCVEWEIMIDATMSTDYSEGTVWAPGSETLATEPKEVAAPERPAASVPELLDVAKNGNKEQAQSLLAKGADPNRAAEDGTRPLALAAGYGNYEVAAALIAAGADVNGKDRYGTPLMEAAAHGNVEIAKLLVAKGADVNAKDQYGSTPLYEAVRYGHKEVAELLLAKGADVNAKVSGSNTPLHEAAHRETNDTPQVVSGKKEVAELLLAKGADMNAKANGGDTPLHYAAWSGNNEVAELLLAKGADVNAKNDDGEAPLGSALEYPQLSSDLRGMVELLLDKGADINAKNNRGSTPLLAALENDARVDTVVELLVSRGADVNATDATGETALKYEKMHRDDKNVVKLLKKHGGHE
jgi:ankyrin repeat protein